MKVILLNKFVWQKPLVWLELKSDTRIRKSTCLKFEVRSWSLKLKFEVWSWSFKLKLSFEDEVQIRKLKCVVWGWLLSWNLRFEFWSWSLQIKFPVGVWSWSTQFEGKVSKWCSKLKPVVEFCSWSLKLELKFIVKVVILLQLPRTFGIFYSEITGVLDRVKPF